jgi:hypothetical protein
MLVYSNFISGSSVVSVDCGSWLGISDGNKRANLGTLYIPLLGYV